jgi:hypothetical protein
MPNVRNANANLNLTPTCFIERIKKFLGPGFHRGDGLNPIFSHVLNGYAAANYILDSLKETG